MRQKQHHQITQKYMTSPSAKSPLVDDWLEESRCALTAAKDNFTMGHYWACCFMSHLSAEKSLKALKYFTGSKPETLRTHSLLELYDDLLPKLAGLAEVAKDVELLDGYAVSTRYMMLPERVSPHDRFGKNEGKEAIPAAERIYQAASRITKLAEGIING